MAELSFPEFVTPSDPCNLEVRRCPVTAEKASRRILIQRNGAHGDILMATPFLTALRDNWPDAHITWIVERKESPSINAHPLVDELLYWDTSYWKRMVRRGMIFPWILQGLKMRSLLQARNYDIFVSYQPEEWQLLARACGAKIRIGVFDTFRQFSGEAKTSKNTQYYTHSYTFDELPLHRTDQYLLPLKALGLSEPDVKQMTMGVTSEDIQKVDKILKEGGIDSGHPLVVLAPMTTWPSRCWPAERFAGLGNRLHSEGAAVVLIGSAKEEWDIREIASRMQKTNPLVLAGNLGFREVAALISRADLLISGDTGPMHVAAAVGTSYLSLFGPTPVEGRAPLAGRGTVLMHPVRCGPCDQKICPNKGEDHLLCMRLISVEEALSAALRLLPTYKGRVESPK